MNKEDDLHHSIYEMLVTADTSFTNTDRQATFLEITDRILAIINSQRAATEEIYIPKQVMRELFRYANHGVHLKVVHEVFNGEKIVRYIANDKLVLWSGQESVDESSTNVIQSNDVTQEGDS